ncbi:cell wall anchor protein [Corynebacterium mendelii]|uniref:Cell wall anchor protein n=1 Tax=Corynebacterium mendelii TaxID=2765362 RepID=A0A939IX44_9CORY|nr:cell wall anchor protein [Corynebacterium mendelii]MBN9643282.1 cell wall anchor protein [Corynebacterium mendelii]
MARKKTAGAFDIRNIIGLLLGLYGILLVISAALLDPGVNPDTNIAKSSADNLWVGVVMIIVAAVFFVWTKLKPIVVAAEPEK